MTGHPGDNKHCKPAASLVWSRQVWSLLSLCIDSQTSPGLFRTSKAGLAVLHRPTHTIFHTFSSYDSDKHAVRSEMWCVTCSGVQGGDIMLPHGPPHLLQWYCPMSPHCSYDLASLWPDQNEAGLESVLQQVLTCSWTREPQRCWEVNVGCLCFQLMLS